MNQRYLCELRQRYLQQRYQVQTLFSIPYIRSFVPFVKIDTVACADGVYVSTTRLSSSNASRFLDEIMPVHRMLSTQEEKMYFDRRPESWSDIHTTKKVTGGLVKCRHANAT